MKRFAPSGLGEPSGCRASRSSGALPAAGARRPGSGCAPSPEHIGRVGVRAHEFAGGRSIQVCRRVEPRDDRLHRDQLVCGRVDRGLIQRVRVLAGEEQRQPERVAHLVEDRHLPRVSVVQVHAPVRRRGEHGSVVADPGGPGGPRHAEPVPGSNGSFRKAASRFFTFCTMPVSSSSKRSSVRSCRNRSEGTIRSNEVPSRPRRRKDRPRPRRR